MQRGSTAGVVLVILGSMVAIVSGYFLFKKDPAPVEVPQQTVETAAPEQNVRRTRSFVVLDNNFAYSGGSVYYRSGKASDGEPLYTVLPVSKPEEFVKVGSAEAPKPASGSTAYGGSYSTYAQAAYSGQSAPVSGSSGQSEVQQSQSSGNTDLGSAYGTGSPNYSVSYYTDGENVYMIVESDGGTSVPQVVVGADPDTFEVLNAEYAKDAVSVYVVIVTCTEDSCSATISVIASADPDTFQAFSNEQQVLNDECDGYVTADAQDQNHVYNNGQVVQGISVYLIGHGGSCDDTPVLISP